MGVYREIRMEYMKIFGQNILQVYSNYIMDVYREIKIENFIFFG